MGVIPTYSCFLPLPPSLLAHAQPEHTLYSGAPPQENARQKIKSLKVHYEGEAETHFCNFIPFCRGAVKKP